MKKTIRLNKDILISCVVLLLLLLSNYIIYFKLSAITISIVFIISIITLVILYNFSVDKLLNFFIFLLVLYPKKPISAEWTNKFLNEILVEANFFESISFFDLFILPIFSIILFIKAYKSYYKPNIEIYSGYLIVLLFVLGYVISIMINSINAPVLSLTRIALILLFSSQILIIPSLLIFKELLIKKVSLFENLIIFLIFLLSFELLLLSLGLLPVDIIRQSVDWREGFRSVFFGFSVFVGFFMVLGFFVSIIKFIKSKKSLYLVTAFLSLFIQLLTFDRTPLLASFIFIILIIVLKYKLKSVLGFIIILPIIISLSSITYNSIQESDVAKVKSNGFFDTESTFDRIGIQFRYIDAMIDNYFLPAGIKTNSTFYKKEINRNFNFTNDIRMAYNGVSSIKITASHNILVQFAFEIGFASFIMYIIIIGKQIISNFRRKNKYYYAFGISILIFYFFQASPTYYFLPIMIFIFSSNYIDPRSKYNSLGYKK